MRAHRLQRLKLLTQGVALLGIGGQPGCHDQPPDTVHINAPFVVYDAGATSAEPVHVNAPPMVPPDAGSAAPTASNSGAPDPAPSVKPPFLVPHMNATATPPKHVNGPPKP
jgi:hypothetical protein